MTVPTTSAEFMKLFPECKIQTFDDVEVNGIKRSDPKLARVFSTYEETLIQKLQEEGAGIYFAVNSTKGMERRIESLKHISAVALDVDVAKEKEGLNSFELHQKKRRNAGKDQKARDTTSLYNRDEKRITARLEVCLV